MTTENQKPEEQVEELPIPDFLKGGVVLTCNVTVINPVYRTDNENPELPKDN